MWYRKKQALGCFVLLVTLINCTSIDAQSRFVTTRGKLIISPDGKPLLLKGINLGNWLLPEGYMFKFKQTNSPRLIQTAISELVGEDEARRFWKTYRDNYITREDIAFIKQAGFNSVRVPFSYRLFVSEGPGPKLEGPGYELLDRVVDWCRKEGLYVILDMHAAPGGQTGDNIDDSFGYPFLFVDERSKLATIDLWKRIAERYKDETTVIGYDLLNEPIPHYFRDLDALNTQLVPLYKR